MFANNKNCILLDEEPFNSQINGYGSDLDVVIPENPPLTESGLVAGSSANPNSVSIDEKSADDDKINYARVKVKYSEFVVDIREVFTRNSDREFEPLMPEDEFDYIKNFKYYIANGDDSPHLRGIILQLSKNYIGLDTITEPVESEPESSGFNSDRKRTYQRIIIDSEKLLSKKRKLVS